MNKRGVAGLFAVVLLCACGGTLDDDRAPSAADVDARADGPGIDVTVKTHPGTFVWLEALFAHDFPPPDGKVYMDQQGQMFIPGTLLARTGQDIEFSSSEDILHNVRVIRSDRTPIFNVATPPFGAYTHKFDGPGLYDVTCDIHSAMKATIYIAGTPYIGTSDDTGRYTFRNVVPGTYSAGTFESGRPVHRTVEVAGPQGEIDLF